MTKRKLPADLINSVLKYSSDGRSRSILRSLGGKTKKSYPPKKLNITNVEPEFENHTSHKLQDNIKDFNKGYSFMTSKKDNLIDAKLRTLAEQVPFGKKKKLFRK